MLLIPWKAAILITVKQKAVKNLFRPSSDTTSMVFESDRTVPLKFLCGLAVYFVLTRGDLQRRE